MPNHDGGYVAWPADASMGVRAVGCGGSIDLAIKDAASRGFDSVVVRPVNGRHYDAICDYLLSDDSAPVVR